MNIAVGVLNVSERGVPLQVFNKIRYAKSGGSWVVGILGVETGSSP